MGSSLASWLRCTWVKSRRRRLRRSEVPSAFHSVLEAGLPGPGEDVRSVRFLSLDFETTGLDPGKDRIVSAGWVQIAQGAIHLGTARERLVRPGVDLSPTSVQVHGIGDDRAARGVEEEEMLTDLLGDLAGHVLVAHHARLEAGFLAAALRRRFGASLPFLVVDTLRLERRLRRRDAVRLPVPVPEDAEALGLSSVRRRYHLPRHRAHRALPDALATAELLLAQWAYMRPRDGLTLARLI